MKNLAKLFVLSILLVAMVGCEEKDINNPSGNPDTNINDENNNVNNDNTNNDNSDNNMVGLTGYLVVDDEYKNRYYGFTNDSGEKLTKQINVNGTNYKFDVEMTNSNNKLEYKIYLNDKLLDTITFEIDVPEQKNIDLFVLDGYAVVGYKNSYVNVYNINSYKLVDSLNFFSEFTAIVNEFVLTNNSLSFVDVSNCPFAKVNIQVKNNDVEITRQTMTTDELDTYEISGGAC